VTKKDILHHPPSTAHHSRLIPFGAITTAHGIRGEVKVRSFTADPRDITAYGPLRDASGRSFNLTVTGGSKDALIARIEGVNTREAAEALRGTELLIPRDALPKPKDNEYYHEDLVGLTLITESGEVYGTIAGVHNFGAGDLIAVRQRSGEEDFLPFTRTIFPRVDIEKGTVLIVPPEIAPPEDAPDDA
jgi:16S rRNA processing protein RimM